MFARARSHLTYANVMATVAVFVALGGGAYAAVKLPKNSVGGTQIKSNSINSAKVKNGSLLALDFKAGQLPAGPAGAAGVKGDKGDTGLQGVGGGQGEKGAEGKTGPTGPQGPGAVKKEFSWTLPTINTWDQNLLVVSASDPGDGLYAYCSHEGDGTMYASMWIANYQGTVGDEGSAGWTESSGSAKQQSNVAPAGDDASSIMSVTSATIGPKEASGQAMYQDGDDDKLWLVPFHIVVDGTAKTCKFEGAVIPTG